MEDIDAAFKSGVTRDAEPNLVSSAEGPEKNNGATPALTASSSTQSDMTGSRVTLSGLLNALDGIGAQEGRILFATTNRYSTLDSALTRPGRMDLHIEFRHATSAQAEDLFKYFYLPSGGQPGVKAEATLNDSARGQSATHVENSDDDADHPLIDFDDEKFFAAQTSPTPPLSPVSDAQEIRTPDLSPGFPSSYTGTSHNARAPKLPREQYLALAKRFGQHIPDDEFSMASLQGYLMAYKARPMEAVRDVHDWMEKQREERARKTK